MSENFRAIGRASPERQLLCAWLRGEPLALRWELLGLRRARSWRARIYFVAEPLFPPRGHVQQKYRCVNRQMLPFYYIRRAVDGIWKRL